LTAVTLSRDAQARPMYLAARTSSSDLYEVWFSRRGAKLRWRKKWNRQMGALRAQRCDKVFAEKALAKSLRGRPQLDTRRSTLWGPGDVPQAEAHGCSAAHAVGGKREGNRPGHGCGSHDHQPRNRI